MKILIFEPDEYYQSLLQHVLADVAQLVFVSSLDEGMYFLKRERPDMIISELLFQDASGYDLLVQLRSEELYKDTPVVVYTRVQHADDVGSAMAFGILKYFIKGTDSVQEIRECVLSQYN